MAAIGPAVAAERLLAGVLLAVAVAGAVLVPRLLVELSPRHELGVAAPGMAAPPVVLAPGLPAQSAQPRAAAAGAQSHATRIAVVAPRSTSQPKAQGSATSPVALRPPPAQSGPPAQPEPQAEPQPKSEPTIHALTPTPAAAGTSTCDCVPTRGGATASRHTTAKPPATPRPHRHPSPKPQLPKLAKLAKLSKSHGKPRPHADDPRAQHEVPPPEHPQPQLPPAPKPGHEAAPQGHGNGHKP